MKAFQEIQPKTMQAGFTILEVMVAISILAIGLMAVFSGQNMAIQGSNRANRMTEGMTLAQDKVEELLGLSYTHPDLDPNGNPHTEQHPPPGYEIKWTVTEYSADNYKLIAVEVNGQGLRKKLELNCIRTLL